MPEDEATIFRRMLWLNHGHKGMYGDDGEMQCGACVHEYGFWDWKRTPASEIEKKIINANLRKLANKPIEPTTTHCSCEPGQGGPCSFCMETKYNL